MGSCIPKNRSEAIRLLEEWHSMSDSNQEINNLQQKEFYQNIIYKKKQTMTPLLDISQNKLLNQRKSLKSYYTKSSSIEHI